jgi:cobalt-zinc-cadmium efflux system membrane fusion protein
MRLAILSTLLLGFAWLSGCTKAESKKTADNGPSKVEAARDPAVIEVDHPERFELVTAAAVAGSEELPVNGAVAPDVSRNVPVNALSGGRVVEVKARLYDEVQKGQLLLRMVSPDLTQAISDYRKFQADEVLARRQLERAQLLLSKGAMAEKDVQAAEDTEVKAKVDVQTALDRIQLLGGDGKTLQPYIDLVAPVSGTIVEQNVTTAAGVKSPDNSPNLFTIADLSRLWVLCDVYENNLGQVHVGDFAEVKLNAYPDKTFRGRVGNIANVLDPNTRSVKVRLELDNAGRLLKPGMFATATFRSQSSKTRVMAPASALLRLHDRDWIYVPIDGGKRFKLTEVQAGPQDSKGMQQILRGVSAGDPVVKGALQLSAAAAAQGSST